MPHGREGSSPSKRMIGLSIEDNPFLLKFLSNYSKAAAQKMLKMLIIAVYDVVGEITERFLLWPGG